MNIAFDPDNCTDMQREHLIAAAPDLLDALDLLLMVTIDHSLAAGVSLTPDEEMAWRVALKAIQRATGAA